MLSLADLRLRHPRFFFDQVDVQIKNQTLLLLLSYHFENGPAFTTSYHFPDFSEEKLATKDQTLIRYWAAQIGMVDGFSYWKAACSAEWVIRVPGISTEQLSFWTNLLHKGMSEFFFINQIDGWQEHFLQFKIENQDNSPQTSDEILIDQHTHQKRLLIPVGGGKDSIVTSELLRQTELPITTLSINSYPRTEEVLNVFWHNSAAPRSHITVERQLDKQLFALKNQGYLNGHTPFSAAVAFVTTLTAYLYDYRYVPVSNEWSANEGNTVFLGQSINHQYTKTVEFEGMFRKYQQKYLSSTTEYFSFLRPLHEIQITELFTQYPQYWPVFLSCNRGQKKGIWCGECPKCLFVAVMLSAFLSVAEINTIFNKDILNDQELLPIFDQLIGFSEVKSLECVGTREETRAAVTLAVRRLDPLPLLLGYGWDRLLKEGNSQQNLDQSAKALLDKLAPTHFLPEEFFKILRNRLTTIQGSHE